MHDCLCISEIQRLVVDELSPSDCSRLAQTSQLFYEVAMDGVWEYVEGLTPLIGCMPTEVWMVKHGHGREDPQMEGISGMEDDSDRENTQIWSFTRKPGLSDWMHFCKHAHRVKLLFICSRNLVRIELDSRRLLNDYLSSQSSEHGAAGLFPNIVSLSIEYLHLSSDSPHKEYLPKMIHHLGGRRLVSLEFSFIEEYILPFRGLELEEISTLRDMLPTLLEVWPQLEEIRLADIMVTWSTVNRDGEGHELFTKFPNLVELRISLPLQTSSITSLAHLSSLRHLALSGNTVSLKNLASSMPFSSFPALTALQLGYYELRLLTPLLNTLHSAHSLESLTLQDISLSESAPQGEMPNAFTAISGISSLRSLSIVVGSNVDPQIVSPAPPSDKLSPLFPLRRLQRLRLVGLYSLSLNDADLELIPSAWPSLCELTLRRKQLKQVYMLDRTTYCLLSLQRLCNGCRELMYLDIDKWPTTLFPSNFSLDAAHLQLSTDNANKLKGLRVPLAIHLGSTLPSADAIAMWIRVSFPVLTLLGTGRDDVWAEWRKFEKRDVHEVRLLLEERLKLEQSSLT